MTKVDSAFRKSILAANPKKTIAREEIRIVPQQSGNNVANTLNNAAYDFYVMGTRNQTYLLKALVWSKRAIDMQPISGYYDTLAHLLYRLNFHDEALLNQNKAIDLAEKENASPQHLNTLKVELDKIKKRQI